MSPNKPGILPEYEPVRRTKADPKTVDIATGGGHLYRRTKTGGVSVYYGSVYGEWLPIYRGTDVTAIAAGRKDLYQLRKDGAIWEYVDKDPEYPFSQPEWKKLDGPTDAKQIAATSRFIYKVGSGDDVFVSRGGKDWSLIGNKKLAAKKIAANEGMLAVLYQNGDLFRYDTDGTDPDRIRLDKSIRDIVVTNKELYALQDDGDLLFYDKGSDSWTELRDGGGSSARNKIRAIVGDDTRLFFQEKDGDLVIYDADTTPKYRKVDRDANITEFIANDGRAYKLTKDGSVFEYVVKSD
jgi:hypothetical protein